MSIKTYSELIMIPKFEDRFKYLVLKGNVGEDTFGFDRYLNQMLYKSGKWHSTRDRVIVRDNGCDLGVEGYEIHGRILIHHINPVTLDDLLNERSIVYDLDNLITTTHRTHNAIHYSDETQLLTGPVVRTQNDTCPWKKQR